MSLGRQYHPFTAKATLILFGLLLVSGFGSMFVQIPFLPMLALPANILKGFVMGAIGVSLPGAASMLSTAVFYYLTAVIVGYIVHEFIGNNSGI
jgi:hypothetical protein